MLREHKEEYLNQSEEVISKLRPEDPEERREAGQIRVPGRRSVHTHFLL